MNLPLLRWSSNIHGSILLCSEYFCKVIVQLYHCFSADNFILIALKRADLPFSSFFRPSPVLLPIVLPGAVFRRDSRAGVVQVRGITWCVWGVEIALPDRGRYLVRAAVLCGDLINRSRLHPLSLTRSADPGGQSSFLLLSAVRTETRTDESLNLLLMHTFYSFHPLNIFIYF